MHTPSHTPISASQRSPGRHGVRLASLTLLSLFSLVIATLASSWAPGGAATVALAHGNSAAYSIYDDWPMYQHDIQRSGASGAAIIGPMDMPQLRPQWTYQTGSGLVAEPAIVSGVAYVGSWDGYEYAINTSTGQVIWKTFLGTTSVPGCFPFNAGVSSSATVQNGMVYVGGGDSYWYALNASDGTVAWRVFVGDNSVTGGHYNWSSPAIYNGYAFVGTASFGDCPLVQGQVLQIDLTSHQVVNTFNLVPNGQTGGGIWGSPTVDPATGTVYVATGNSSWGPGYYGQGIVALDATTLALKDFWVVPQNQANGDSDFGNTPILFTDGNGRQLVGAVNKNGIVYALLRSNLAAGPVWQTTVAYGGECPECGDGSVSSMTFANNTLYVAGGNTSINGVGFGGSVNALNPTTGAFIWRHGETNSALAPVTYDDGVIYSEPGAYFEAFDANAGTRLFSYKVGGMYAGASISNGQVIFGSTNGTIYDMALPATTPIAPGDANCPSGWTCQDIGSPSTPGSESASGSTWTISADGAGVTGTSDQFRLIYQTVGGVSSQVAASVQAPSATSASAQAGVMFRQSTDANSPFYALYLAPSGALAIAYRNAFGGAAVAYTTSVSASGSTPLYLQIQRTSDTYSAATSTDGVNFTLVPGTTRTVVMPDQQMEGVFASSGVNGALGSATVSAAAAGAISDTPAPAPSADPCPTGWSCQDIGNGAPVGDQTLSNGTWSITGGGSSLTNLYDQFHYVWQTMTNDGTLSAHVASQTNTSNSALAGVMLRLTTDPGSPYYAVTVTPGNGIQVYDRADVGMREDNPASLSGITAPVYLRVSRFGTTFSAYYSTDNTNWTLISGSAVDMPAVTGKLLAGMMVDSNTTTKTSVATFDSVAFSSCPGGWQCADIGAPALAGGQTSNGGNWSIQGSGADIFGTSDQFHYVWEAMAGDGTLSAHVASQTNTSSWAKAGLMLRLTSDPGSPFYDVVVSPSNGIVAQWRKVQGGKAQGTASVTGLAAPVWVEISRNGTTYSGYYSVDGVTWTLIPGSTVSIAALTGSLDAGMAVTSHKTTAVSTATFDSLTVNTCPNSWQCADIGAPAMAGGQLSSNGTWTIQGGGADIWGTADQFHYVWQSLTTDGAITAHVASQDATDIWAKAGVMLRLTSDPGSPFFDVIVTPSNGVAAQWRTTQGGSANTSTVVTGLAAPVWVRAARAGTLYSGYYSTDGVNWTLIPGSTMPISALTGTVQAGMAVTAHNAGLLGTATFDTVSINSCPGGWQCADIGAPALAGNQVSNNGTWTIQGGGTDIWGTADQFHYVWQTMAGDGSFSAHIASQTNTSGWAKAGVMLRLTSDPGAPFYDVLVTPSNGVMAQWRTAQGATAQGTASVTGLAAPVWVEIARSGTSYSGYYSTDGVNWTLIPGSTITIAALTGSLDAGMAVTSHNKSALGTATFDTVTLNTCVVGWQCADIGAPALAGGQSSSNGTWTIQGAGADIWGTADQFHYVWKSLPADGAITAHVASQTNTSPWAKSGVMLRLSTDPGAPFYDVFVTPSNGVAAQWRTTQGGGAQGTASVTGLVAPTWVMITRSATTYSGYYSTDGVNWTLIPGSTVSIAALSGSLNAGLFVTSHNTNAIGTATFDTVSIG
ncbi:MAG TPA: PQQ-binding-like beta-propeller repeat protein [Ktedonobacterales bacterium]